MTTNVFGATAQNQLWFDGVQDNLDKRSTAVGISKVYTGKDRVLHNPYNSTPVGSDGVASPTFSKNPFSSTDNSLTVDRRAVVAEQVDNIEELQTNYSLLSQRAERASYVIRDVVDQYMLNLPVSFSGVNDLDAGSIVGGASTGVAYQATTTNVDEISNKIVEEVAFNDGAVDNGMFWVVDPSVRSKLTNFQQNNAFSLSDAAIRNGFVGEDFAGLRIYVSNNLTHNVSLGLATNPTAGDTITFTVPGNGGGRKSVTVTFVATLSGGAGEIHITSTADLTRANLATFLNSYGATAVVEATDAGAAALSSADQDALKRAQIVTVNDDTANTLAVTVKGSLKVAETLTAGGDVFGNVGIHTIAGVMNSMFLALPRDGMKMRHYPVSLEHGDEMVTSQVYNGTIWENKKGELQDVFLYI